jgi:eukaryotic-like serine/threonine-protein kinase
MIGRVIQNYRIEELLGEGGMGTVYRATDTLLQRPVALKMLHTHLLRDVTFFERFRNEAVLSARLNHPNVATLYNFIKDRDDSFMVMEFVDGATLEQLRQKQGRFSLENAVRTIVQALEGLGHAHRKEILHRDIKPANLMLTREGCVKLMDFGIARLVGSERLTRVNRVMGTLEYMAPELLDGGDPSVQSDLYAAGVLLYELLSGQMPFKPGTDSTLITHILSHKPIPIGEHTVGLPKAIEDILDKLLQKKPERRYQSASELRLALAGLVAPGPLDWQQFQQPGAAQIPKPATAVPPKPKLEPTRLAGWPAQGYAKRWAAIKGNVVSQEGLILLGALLLAFGILLTGFWMASPEAESTRPSQVLPYLDSLVVQADNKDSKADLPPEPVQRTAILYDTRLPNYTASPQPRSAELPRSKEGPTPKQAPRPQSPDTRDQQEEPTDTEEKLPALKEEEKAVSREENTEKPTKEPAPTSRSEPRTVAVELHNETFAVEFSESISSEQTSRVGGTIWLRVQTPVVINGTTVIASDARVRGRITDARSGTLTQRAYLAVQFEAVQAVNGQWISIRFPEYSNKASDRVLFERGRRVNGVRVVRTSLVMRQ